MPQDNIQIKLAELAELFSQIDSQERLVTFLDGLLTPSEVEGLHLRWSLLKLLDQGLTQRDIMAHTGISLGKISRGARLMKYGPEDFKKLVHELAEHQSKDTTANEKDR